MRSRRQWWFGVCLTATLFGCTDVDPWRFASLPSPAARADNGAADVVGTRVLRWVTEYGEIDLPDDVERAQIGAWVDGTFYPGSGQRDGIFLIPGVPPDLTYLLRFNRDYVMTSARTLDLGFWLKGRPDAVSAEQGTRLAIALSGLNPWGVADDLELFSANAGVAGFNIWADDIDHTVPRPGTTYLVQTLDYLAIFPQVLIEATRGDQTIVHQLVTKYAGMPGAGAVYAAAAKALSTSSLTVVNRQTSSLAGTLADVLQDNTFSLNWALSTFHAYGSQVHPSAQFQDDELYIAVLRDSASHGFYDAAPDLVEAYVPPGTSDQTFEFIYGNPFPSEWGEPFAESLTRYVMAYLAPGATLPYLANANLGYADLLSNFPVDHNIQMSPPRNVSINGQIATGDLSGIGLTPTISWDPPEVGTPIYYRVTLRELTVSGIQTQAPTRGRFFTADTSLSVPPGVLADGRRYFVAIGAYNRGGPDFRQAPLQTGLPLAFASALTGTFVP